MGWLTGKRPDGVRVQHRDPLMAMMPYIMRTRTESVVYYKRTIEIENIQKFIVEQRRKGVRITLFNVIVTALLNTVYRRPDLNQYIMGRRLYKHKEFEVLYTVKQSLSDDGLESVAKVVLSPDDTIYTVARKMREHTNQIKKGELKEDDQFIRMVNHFPRWLLRMIAACLRFLDYFGWLPKSMIESLPFYSTVFVSHLGSLGADAPFHHLYEFGTTSVFLTIGRTYEAPFKADDGGVEWRRVIDLAFTVDERICDGFYLIRSLKILEQFLAHPYLLEHRVDELVDVYRPGRVHRPQEQEQGQGAEAEKTEENKKNEEPYASEEPSVQSVHTEE